MRVERSAKPIFIAGICIVVLGTIFTLQSAEMIGPESSFMYANPEWSINGAAILTAGIITCAAGLVVTRYRSQS